MAAAQPNTNKRVAQVGLSGLGASYTVAAGADLNQYHSAGRVEPLAYRAEATFAASGGVTAVTFKIQCARSTDGFATASSPLWTDVALYDAKVPGTAAVEWTINETAGATVALDVFCISAHRGRNYLRVLTKAAGTAAAGDAFSLWGPG